ncbi:hypothetical protein CIPAW_02G104200 [Carya illinoinensis]|uniref:Uncharacterized protein n=1 Tax=Carya illinoinensis TaxID=32201 RepID=A0A8T1RE02_CARIL|nr:hypothetical protein CIPAW_02G104200 [Carya illinoinensis]
MRDGWHLPDGDGNSLQAYLLPTHPAICRKSLKGQSRRTRPGRYSSQRS